MTIFTTLTKPPSSREHGGLDDGKVSSALFEGGDKYLLLDDTHTAHVSEKGLFFGIGDL